MLAKIKKGDEVIVLKGKSRGVHGKVLRTLLAEKKVKKVIVEGANIVKKCVRPNPQKNERGGILEREAPIALANVAIYNTVTGKADRIAIKVLEDGRKVRCFKSNREFIDKV